MALPRDAQNSNDINGLTLGFRKSLLIDPQGVFRTPPKNENAAPSGKGSGENLDTEALGTPETYSTTHDVESGNLTLSEAILADARRAIALGRVFELARQSARLGELVCDGVLAKADAVDALYDAAMACGLVETHGDDFIHAALSAGFQEGAR